MNFMESNENVLNLGIGKIEPWYSSVTVNDLTTEKGKGMGIMVRFIHVPLLAFKERM